jgi:hypothetical protein
VSRYRDFDHGRQEAEKEPIVFDILGVHIELPSELPAIIPITGLRLLKQYGSEADIPQQETMELALKMLGEEALNKLLAAGISVDRLQEVIQWLFNVYSGVEDSDEAGNLTAPEVGPETQST